MIIFKLLVFILSISLSSLATPKDIHPDLAKLKLYRTYYNLVLESPTAEQFEVWYQFKDENGFLESKIFHLALSKVEDAYPIKINKYLTTNQFFGGNPFPSKNFVKVPDTLKDYEAGIIRSVRENHSDKDIQKIEVQYIGKYARILIYEMIPISQNSKDPSQVAIKSFCSYFADLNNGTLKAFGSNFSLFGFLDFTAKDIGLKPKWVDFVLPSKIEGSSLLALDSMDINQEEKKLVPIYEESKLTLNKKILNLARSIEANANFNSPIEAILQKQSSTLLPENLNQSIQLNIQFYGRTTDFTHQLSGLINFKIPVKLGSYHFTKMDEAKHLTFSLNSFIDESKMTLQLKVTNQNGNTIEKTFVAEGEKNFHLIKDGNTTILGGITYLSSDDQKFSLPGHGEFTQFDIYPQEDLYPSLLTGPNH